VPIPTFQRRDLFERIERGDYPEWELGPQLFDEAFANSQPYDVLDATKIIPEEEVPVRIVGKLVLDRYPDNYFAETEQAAFVPNHVVPGIGFSNDSLLQGRLFSYTDTQLSRLGSVNFYQLPINAAEQAHIASALVFELSKVSHDHIRTAMMANLRNVDETLAQRVAAGLTMVFAARAADRRPRARHGAVAGAADHPRAAGEAHAGRADGRHPHCRRFRCGRGRHADRRRGERQASCPADRAQGRQGAVVRRLGGCGGQAAVRPILVDG
jgi:hypothetical protein